MPRTPINDLYYYHIYNRGVDKRRIFMDKWDYVRFIEEMRWFNCTKPIGSLYILKKNQSQLSGSTTLRVVEPLSKPLIDIIAYCLNPNHFHLLVRQISEDGISKFMHKLSGGYTKYFNEKYHRTGVLFQGKYKVKEITSTIDLLKVSVYINCNAEIHGITKAENWPWSSYLDYVGMRRGTLCNKEETLNEFTNIEPSERPQRYRGYCREWIGDMRKIKSLMKFDL